MLFENTSDKNIHELVAPLVPSPLMFTPSRNQSISMLKCCPAPSLL